MYKIIINLRVAAYEQSNVVGERFSADDSRKNSPNTTPPSPCIFLHVPPILLIVLLTYLCTLESHCWKVSARPSARLPLNSNLSVVPAGRPKALSRPRSLQCNKTVLLLVLLVKLQSYDVWKAG